MIYTRAGIDMSFRAYLNDILAGVFNLSFLVSPDTADMLWALLVWLAVF